MTEPKKGRKVWTKPQIKRLGKMKDLQGQPE